VPPPTPTPEAATVNPDARTPRLPVPVWALIAILAAALAWLHVQRTVIGPDAARFDFDSAEYALAGRQLLETGRLQTPFVHPAALGDAPGPPWPLLVGHPLVPVLDAIAFAVTGPDPLATLWPAMLADVTTVLLVVALALALSGSGIVALGAGAAFAVSPWALRHASVGLSEMPFAACLTAAFLLLWRLPERPRPFLLGFVLGVAHLARPVAVPLLPAFALGILLLARPERRARDLVRAALGFAPLALLLALEKWASIGSPFAGASGYLLLNGASPEFTMTRLNRMVPPPEALPWIQAHLGPWIERVVRNARSVAYHAIVLGGRWPAALAGLTLVVALARGGARARGFALAVVATTVLLVGLVAATVADPRLLFPLLPTGIAVAFAGLARAAEAVGRGRRVAVAAAVVVTVAWAAWPLAREWRASGTGELPADRFHEREWRGLGVSVAPLLPPEGLVASDAAPWIAWYTRRPTTLVPLEPEAVALGPGRLRPEAVVLTNEWLIRRPGEEAWAAAFQARTAPPGFHFAGHVRSGRLEAVVFRRDPTP